MDGQSLETSRAQMKDESERSWTGWWSGLDRVNDSGSTSTVMQST